MVSLLNNCSAECDQYKKAQGQCRILSITTRITLELSSQCSQVSTIVHSGGLISQFDLTMKR